MQQTQSAQEGGLWAVLSPQNISFSKGCCQTGEYAGNMYCTIRWSWEGRREKIKSSYTKLSTATSPLGLLRLRRQQKHFPAVPLGAALPVCLSPSWWHLGTALSLIIPKGKWAFIPFYTLPIWFAQGHWEHRQNFRFSLFYHCLMCHCNPHFLHLFPPCLQFTFLASCTGYGNPLHFGKSSCSGKC